MSIHLPQPAPLPAALTQSGLTQGCLYTVRLAMRVPVCKDRCLRGDTGNSELLHLTREITSGTRLELHHHDPATGHAYLTIYTTGEAVRVPETHLTPWT